MLNNDNDYISLTSDMCDKLKTLYNGELNTTYLTASSGNIHLEFLESNEADIDFLRVKYDVLVESDEKIKSDVVNLSNCLKIINDLRPCFYKKHYNKNGNLSENPDLNSNEYKEFIYESGLIAQELLKIDSLNHLVHKNENELLSINYIGLIPYLIGAINEINNKLENQ